MQDGYTARYSSVILFTLLPVNLESVTVIPHAFSRFLQPLIISFLHIISMVERRENAAMVDAPNLPTYYIVPLVVPRLRRKPGLFGTCVPCVSKRFFV